MATGLSSANLAIPILETIRGTQTFSTGQPWVALHLGDPGAVGTANSSSITTRVQPTPFTWDFWGGNQLGWNASTELIWPERTATETITHVSFWNAETGGNFLWSAPVAGGWVEVAEGDIPSLQQPLFSWWFGTIGLSVIRALVLGSTISIPGTYLALHTGSAGANGLSNPSALTTRRQATFSRSNHTLSLASTPTAWTMDASEIISEVSVWDAATGGNFLFSIPLAAGRGVVPGETFTMQSLSVTLGPIAS